MLDSLSYKVDRYMMNTDNAKETNSTKQSDLQTSQHRKRYVPPYPTPHEKTLKPFKRFWVILRESWLSTFHKKSYTMKMGQTKLPTHQTFTVNQPDLVKKVLIKNYKDFPKSKKLYQMLTPLLGDSIFITNGKQWEEQRAMMNKALSASNIRRVFPLMVEAVECITEQLFDEHIESGKTTVNISQAMAHLTADIIFRTIYTHPLSQEDSDTIFYSFAEYQKRVSVVQSVIFFMGLPDSFIRFYTGKQANKIRGVIAKNINQRIADLKENPEVEYEDILSFMMEAKHPETGEGFSEVELVDQIALLFLAGHETSATTLSWCIYLMANQPELQEELAQEATAVKPAGAFDFGDIRQLKQVQNVFKETLRLYPPVGVFMREATQQECMRDKTVYPKDTVFVMPWLLHRREDIWPDAHSFDPDRFSCPHHKDAIRKTYYPYSAGPRVCVGASFANQEGVLTIASLMRRYRFRPIAGNNPKPAGYLTIKPEPDVMLEVNRR